jgi:hypothetical protein
MGLKQFLKWIWDSEPKKKTTLTDSDRELGLEMRRLKYNLRQKEKMVELMKRIDDISERTNPKKSSTDLIVETVLPIIATKLATQDNGNKKIGDVPNNYTEEQIDNFLKQNKQVVKKAKEASDDDIREFLISQDPNISPQSIHMVIQKIRK